MALITLEEAKEYLRVDTDADDALIGSLLLSAGRLCADVARLSDEEWAAVEADDSGDDSPEVISLRASLRVAVYFTLAYLYEHREEADHHGLLLTLRSLLFSVREGRP
jgi:hypothetical protein